MSERDECTIRIVAPTLYVKPVPTYLLHMLPLKSKSSAIIPCTVILPTPFHSSLSSISAGQLLTHSLSHNRSNEWMGRTDRPLVVVVVTDASVELEKWLVEVQDLGKSTHHFRGIYRILYVKLIIIKKNRKITTRKPGSWPALGSTRVLTPLYMPKNLPGYWTGGSLYSLQIFGTVSVGILRQLQI